jgi:hypothetical protein
MDYSQVAKQLGRCGGGKTFKQYSKDYFEGLSKKEARILKLKGKDINDKQSTA